jgi:MFS transporter, SP family, general alpha glucoside:H+ symporter
VGSVVACQHYPGVKSFRIPYALQWMWPLPLAVGIYLAPESPWWLVRKGKVEDAKKALYVMIHIVTFTGGNANCDA